MLRPKLGRIWGDSNSVARRDPGDEKYLKGWLSEIPTYQVLNYLQWKTDSTLQALAERGVLEWGGDATYRNGAAVWDESNGVIYVAKLDGPSKTLKPSSNLAQWTPSALQITRADYDAISAAIASHIADVTSNPHGLTPGRLGTYTTAQIDALVAQYKKMVSDHAARKDNPHGVTATDIGAVPVTGGAYTGNVEMKTGQVLLSADGVRKIKADDTGVYMANSAGQVGVDAAGEGFVKTGNAPATKIITKATFADNKAAVEATYAVQQPVFYLPLASDLNVYIGGGTVQADQNGGVLDWNPSLLNGVIFGNNTQYDNRVVYTYKPLEGLKEATICVDVFLEGTGGTTTTPELYASFGAAAGCGVIQVNKNNTVRFWSETGTTGTVPLPTGVWIRLVGVRTTTSLSLYLNGVMVSTIAVNNANITGSDYNFLRANVQDQAYQRLVKAKNFKLWIGALTAKQISTL